MGTRPLPATCPEPEPTPKPPQPKPSPRAYSDARQLVVDKVRRVMKEGNNGVVVIRCGRRVYRLTFAHRHLLRVARSFWEVAAKIDGRTNRLR